MTVTVKTLKVTVVVPPDQLPDAPDESTFVLTIATPDRLRATAQLNAKSYRKTLVAIAQHGAENVAVLVQGQMTKPGIIDSAGISAVPKKPKETADTAA